MDPAFRLKSKRSIAAKVRDLGIGANESFETGSIANPSLLIPDVVRTRLEKTQDWRFDQTRFKTFKPQVGIPERYAHTLRML